jgi:hypothetical protein
MQIEDIIEEYKNKQNFSKPSNFAIINEKTKSDEINNNDKD